MQGKIEDKKLENENPQENFEDTVTNDQESENLYFNTSENQKNSEQKTESISENQIRDLKDYVLSRGSTNDWQILGFSVRCRRNNNRAG